MDKRLFTQVMDTLAENSLFLKIIELCPIPDIQVEELLTSLREQLLMCKDSYEASDNKLALQKSLALHCFTNEYIFNETDKENHKIKNLERSIENSILEGKRLDPFDLLNLASYRPLYDYSWSRQITIPNGLDELYKRQVTDYFEEHQLAATIEKINIIKNHTYMLEQNNYLEKP